MATLQQWGISLIQALQAWSPALDGPMNFFTFLGKIEFYLIFIPFIYWAIDRRLGMRVLLLLITSNFLATSLKLLFHQPRPFWIGGIKALAQEATYGIPSAHASDSLAVWGYLVYRLKKTWLWILAAALVVFIGISRLYLAVHFPHDVIFGWLLGALWLWLFAKSEGRVTGWANQQGLAGQIGAGLAISLVAVLIGGLFQMWLSRIPDPAQWSAFTVAARAYSHTFTLAGSVFGVISGYALMKHLAPFETGGGWLQRIGRYLLGIIGVLILYFGMDTLFSLIAADETGPGYALRYLRYASVTFWVMFIAPWLFLKVGLANRQPATLSEEPAGAKRARPGTAQV